MQSGDTAEQRYGGSSIAVEPEEEVISQGSNADDFLTVQEIELTSAQTDSPVIVTPTDDSVRLASAATSRLETPTLEVPIPDEVIPAGNCGITAEGFTSKAAMIELTLSAPCLPNERVTVHHRGMMFTETTALDGTLKTTLPALD